MSAAAEEFERHRPRLRGLAYRMLGSVSDADDIVQDAFLRWHGTTDRGDDDTIRVPGAWLTTTVTRLCIDRLRDIAVERAAYVGPWLPEPWIGDAEPSTGAATAPDRHLDRAADLSVAFLLLLERLAPEERAAFLLHDVFDVGYGDIAGALGKSEPASRQMVHRARERLRDDRARFQATADDRRRLIEQFLAATEARDETKLLSLFAPDATFTSDGGGKVWAARNVISGATRIVRLVLGLARKLDRHLDHRIVRANGEPAMVTYRDGKPWSVTSIATDGRRILAVYRVLNPDKLGLVPPLAPAAAGKKNLASSVS